MNIGIIGTGAIGSALAKNFTSGGTAVQIAARTAPHAQNLQNTLGHLASAKSVAGLVSNVDVVVLAVPFTELEALIAEHGAALSAAIVIDPSNAVTVDEDGQLRPLLDGQSAGEVVRSLLPAGTRYAKAFSALGADTLRDAAWSEPRVASVFTADDEATTATVTEVIASAGFAPVRVGSNDAIGRVEMGGDLHQFGELQGRTITADEAIELLQ
jgi:8-hydroxy-5-deazaflavin:NADPH oxidoreductase